jgi:hypothetical protein
MLERGQSSGTQVCAVRWKSSDVSEEHVLSTFRAEEQVSKKAVWGIYQALLVIVSSNELISYELDKVENIRIPIFIFAIFI